MLTLHNDLPRLIRIDDYLQGKHDDPYTPDSAGPEYKLLARRSVTNWMRLIVDASAQGLYVDSVRPGRTLPDAPEGARPAPLPEWVHWQNSRLDARQIPVHRAALAYGHSFTLTKKSGTRTLTKGLSPLSTSALFADPANDDTPRAAFTVEVWPSEAGPGEGLMWDEGDEYLVLFESLADATNVIVEYLGSVGEMPVTRFAASVDLDGRTVGVIEPQMVLQDRINQTIFDMLVIQSGGAFTTKTVTGMAPPYEMTYEIDANGVKKLVPKLGPDGQPVLAKVQINAMKLLWAENKDTEFGTLPGTPLEGYLKSIEEAIKQLAAISQTPPHYLLGAIANLSAEALQAAMTSLERKTIAFRQMFGESWERVFRLAAYFEGETEALDDFATEVIWRDMDARALAPVADGLYKLRQMGAPLEGLLELIPGMTKTMLEEWLEHLDDEAGELAEQQAQLSLANSVLRNASARSTGTASQGSQPANGVA